MTVPLTTVQAQALANQGMASVRSGQFAAAQSAFAKLVSEGLASADIHLALAHACQRTGNHAQALQAVDSALALQPQNIGALVFKADCLDAAGKATAASFYQAALKCAGKLQAVPAQWQAVLAHAQNMCTRYAQSFEATLREQLASVDTQVGPPSARFQQSVDLLTGQRLLYPSAPRLYNFPELPTVQFPERSAFPWLTELEAATPDIRREMLAVLNDAQAFTPYVQTDLERPALRQGGMLNNPDWSAYFLWKNGRELPHHAHQCPATVAALEKLPLVRIPGRSPSVLFSLMRAGAHIPAHNGFVNTRLIVHLPLLVPPGCQFRVGNETRKWIEGQAWVFDDAIEHEAWNPSHETRVILLFEVWRPELNAAERAHVTALFESIDRQRGGVGDWGI